VCISIPSDVGKGDVVLIISFQDFDRDTLNFDAGTFGFAHGGGEGSENLELGSEKVFPDSEFADDFGGRGGMAGFLISQFSLHPS
jgi:hypothetical protein